MVFSSKEPLSDSIEGDYSLTYLIVDPYLCRIGFFGGVCYFFSDFLVY